MGAAINEDLLDTCIGQKLERVFNEWGVGEGQQTLQACQRSDPGPDGILLTRGRSRVNGLKRVSKGSASIWDM
jgi:hypothetical protein